MSRKQRKIIENSLLKDIDVPDSVLDRAREELADRNENKSGETVRRRYKLRYLAAFSSCICVLVCAIVLPIAFAPHNNFSDGEYELAELNRENIGSIQDYNDERSTEYLFLTGKRKEAYVYGNGERDILLEEYLIDEGLRLYVVIDNNDSVDILDEYDELKEKRTINGTAVYYGKTDGEYKATFFRGAQKYCLISASDDQSALFEALEHIIK